MMSCRQLMLITLIALLFCATPPLQAEVEILRDLPYLENAGYADDKDKLDIYRPQGAKDAAVVVFIHGGALLRGDKSQQEHIGRFFAGHGYVTVCVNHRLSPGVVHPAHIEDAAASFAWVVRNIGRYGGDADHVALTGHSAGGYLAALLALDSRYLEARGLDTSAIKAVLPISGFFHVERLAPDRPKTVWGEEEEVWRQASPARYVSASAPPTLLLYADGDVAARRQESLDLAAELRSAGQSKVETVQIADRDHVSIWQLLGSAGDATGKHMLQFLGETLSD
jgi:acetyl esterase/lipase